MRQHNYWQPLFTLLSLFLFSLILTGCSSPTKRPFYPRVENLGNSQNMQLTEYEVLDIDLNQEISEEDIRTAVEIAKSQVFKLTPKSKIVLVQSGATVPDTTMQEIMMKHYRVSVYSGISQAKNTPKVFKKNDQSTVTSNNSFIRKLRLASARAKQDKIIVYWGKMELGRLDRESKTRVWEGYNGGSIPSSTEYLRYLVRFAIVDVNTGMWAMYSSINKEAPYKRRSINSTSEDIAQLTKVKDDAYLLSVENLLAQFE